VGRAGTMMRISSISVVTAPPVIPFMSAGSAVSTRFGISIVVIEGGDQKDSGKNDGCGSNDIHGLIMPFILVIIIGVAG